jgi:hypothetical protein
MYFTAMNPFNMHPFFPILLLSRVFQSIRRRTFVLEVLVFVDSGRYKVQVQVTVVVKYCGIRIFLVVMW